MEQSDFWIPRNLEAPSMFFLWEADSALLVGFWIFMGAMLNMFVLGLFLAVVFSRGYEYLKEEGGKGLIMKLVYWYSPSELWVSRRFPSCQRIYIG
ncbi:MAG: type IV conjugative transfer system protein TraL [Methylococcales bacterium]